MLYRIFLCSIFCFGSFVYSKQQDTVSDQCHLVMASTFSNMVIEDHPHLETKAQEKVQRLANFIFEKMVPAKLDKIEFDKDDSSRFTLHFAHSHIGKIPKVEKGAEAGFKGINFKIENKLSGFFSPEDQAIYIEDDSYLGKHSFFKVQYSLKKVKFHINGSGATDIILETDLGSATKEWQENEMIATFKHMIWKKG